MSNDSILELFRQEVETQVAILNQGLLALEANPQSDEAIEALMRAAHSIKGAARMVSLDPVIDLAHGMEDYFVAAQTHIVTLDSNQIDQLLQGVDLLQALSQVHEAEILNWLAEKTGEFDRAQTTIAALLPVNFSESRSSSLVTVEQRSALSHYQPGDDQADVAETVTTPSDRVVRVTTENLNRIMGLAGESLVEANWLQPFADSFTALKSRQLELAKLLETIHTTLVQASIDAERQQAIDTARRKAQECREILSDRLGELEPMPAVPRT